MDVASPRKTIMVVEDDEAIREVLSDSLHDEGYIVLSAQDGEQALALLASMTPDLICLDFHLPGIQGNQLIDAIRERMPADTCPIVLVTAVLRVPREMREAVQAVIKKPFNIAALFETIAHQLSSQADDRSA
jgi:CheY-like chemotaxis protein